jgi:hypothetical protein
MKITFEFATQDDCLDRMVPSDLRVLVAQRDRLQARMAELECMVRAFRACVDLQMVPSWGSPCHDQIHALVGESMEDDQ